MATMDALMYSNGLVYELPIPSSMVMNRTLKRNYFQQNGYQTEQNATCLWNTGTDFVDCANSTLVLKVKTRGSEQYDAGFASGSALNVIDALRISHRSGTVISNSRKLNQYNKITHKMRLSEDSLDTIGSIAGFNQNLTVPPHTNSVSSEEEQEYHIPLKFLHPFFRPENGQLMPNVLCAGLRFDFTWADFREVFKQGTTSVGTLDGYEITGCYFNLMSVVLSDDAIQSISDVASKKSLEWVFEDVFTSQNSSPSSTTVINVDVGKSCSLANNAITIIQPQADILDATKDSYQIRYINNSHHFTLGSNRFPLQDIDSAEGSYHTALVTYDKLSGNKNEKTSIGYSDFFVNNAHLSVNLERDTALSLSASPVSSSRMLRFLCTLDEPITEAHLTTVFLTHMVNLRLTLSSASVDI